MKCCISRNGSFNFKAITGLLVLRRWKCKPAMNADFIFSVTIFWEVVYFFILHPECSVLPLNYSSCWMKQDSNLQPLLRLPIPPIRLTANVGLEPTRLLQTVSGNCAIAATAYRELLRLYYSAYKTHIWFAVNRQISILPLGKLLCPHPLKGSFRRLRLRTGIYDFTF